jgi:hypothetical protein
MSRIVIVILIYRRHKSVDLILRIAFPWYFYFFGDPWNLYEETRHTNAIMWHYFPDNCPHCGNAGLMLVFMPICGHFNASRIHVTNRSVLQQKKRNGFSEMKFWSSNHTASISLGFRLFPAKRLWLWHKNFIRFIFRCACVHISNPRQFSVDSYFSTDLS